MARHLFIADPLASLHPTRDTTVAMIEAAHGRGHQVFVADPLDLAIGEGGPECRVVAVVPTPARIVDGAWQAADPWFEVGPPELRTLSEFAVVSIRLDPPVDRRFLHATFILDHVDPTRTAVVNDPRGLRVANEKLFALHARDHVPPSVVTSDPARLTAFANRHGRAVVKPLDGSGGRGVHLLVPDDPNLRAIVDTATEGGRVHVMAQGFVAEVTETGDRRILVLDGEPVGSYTRLAGDDDFRCNASATRSEQADTIDGPVEAICDALAAPLRTNGLRFVGLDVIGGRLSEVNVTAPTGARQIRLFSGIDVADRYLDLTDRD